MVSTCVLVDSFYVVQFIQLSTAFLSELLFPKKQSSSYFQHCFLSLTSHELRVAFTEPSLNE